MLGTYVMYLGVQRDYGDDYDNWKSSDKDYYE